MNSNYSIYTAMLLGGLASGFTHCVGMCGPFVTMQASANVQADQGKDFTELTRLKNSALLPYHLGRITTYTALAAITAYLSSHIMASIDMQWLVAFMLATSGVIFITYAIGASLPSLFKVKLKIPSFVERKAKPFFKNPRGLNGYILGLILGLLPCGMVFAAILAASSQGSVAVAIPAMMLFGIGTIPALFSISYGSSFLLSRFKLKNFQKFAIFISGIILITTAYNILY